MWIMTSYGILMPAALPQKIQDQTGFALQVRARERAPLTKLRVALLAANFDAGRVRSTPEMDYEFRLYVHAAEFGQLIAQQIAEIDYEKFKPTTARRGGGGDRLHTLYNRIWYVVADHYDSRILGGKGRKK
jgi:hypothetical protein